MTTHDQDDQDYKDGQGWLVMTRDDWEDWDDWDDQG